MNVLMTMENSPSVMTLSGSVSSVIRGLMKVLTRPRTIAASSASCQPPTTRSSPSGDVRQAEDHSCRDSQLQEKPEHGIPPCRQVFVSGVSIPEGGIALRADLAAEQAVLPLQPDPALALVQRQDRVDILGHLAGDAGNGSDLLDACFSQLLERAERLDERLLALGTDTGDVVED